jgi:hypothetical protein
MLRIKIHEPHQVHVGHSHGGVPCTGHHPDAHHHGEAHSHHEGAHRHDTPNNEAHAGHSHNGVPCTGHHHEARGHDDSGHSNTSVSTGLMKFASCPCGGGGPCCTGGSSKQDGKEKGAPESSSTSTGAVGSGGGGSNNAISSDGPLHEIIEGITRSESGVTITKMLLRGTEVVGRISTFHAEMPSDISTHIATSNASAPTTSAMVSALRE